MKVETKKEVFIDYVWITIGIFLVAAGVYFFKIPNNFSTGGVSGIAIILAKFVPYSPATMISIINMALLLVGFIFLGKQFGVKTLYGSVLMSVFVSGLEWICPMSGPMTQEPLLELVYSVILPGVGSAILFNRAGSSGGTDIIAMIVKKYTPLDIGKALFCSDFIIAFTAAIMFGPATGLFSMLGLLSKAVMVDNVIESINASKCFTIITDQPEVITEYIHKTLHRGATMYGAAGTFKDSERQIIVSVMNRGQGKQLKDFIAEVDKHAFVIITNSSNILGKGFRTPL